MLKKEMVFPFPFYRQTFKESYRKKEASFEDALDEDHPKLK